MDDAIRSAELAWPLPYLGLMWIWDWGLDDAPPKKPKAEPKAMPNRPQPEEKPDKESESPLKPKAERLRRWIRDIADGWGSGERPRWRTGHS